MSFASSVPADLPIIPQPVMKSLQSWNFEGLTEQRDRARTLCLHIQAMHQAYDDMRRTDLSNFKDLGEDSECGLYKTGLQAALIKALPAMPREEMQDLVITPEKISDILSSAEHTTLSPQGSENKEFMTRICTEANKPIKLGAICAHPEKLELIVDFLKKNPKQAVSFACGYPHSSFSAAEAEESIKDVHKFMAKHKLKNPVEINTVAHYAAWMDGDTDLVRDIFTAEARACAAAGFTLKTAMKSLVHASATRNTLYGEDYFRSVYDMASMAMEAARDEGLDAFYLQTGTGLPANAPFNNSVALDVTYAESAAPVFMAVADFNAENDPQVGVKVAGGIKNEKDIVGLAYLHKHSATVTNTKPLITETNIHSLAQLTSAMCVLQQMNNDYRLDTTILTSPASPAPKI